MINIKRIHTSKYKYTDINSELLFLGLFQHKEFNSEQRALDHLLNNHISQATECEGFIGEKNKTVLIYGNDSIKRVVIMGLGEKEKYSTDEVRSVAANITNYANDLNVTTISVDGQSFGLQNNLFTQAFSEGLSLGSYVFQNYKSNDGKKTVVNSATIFGDIDQLALNKGFVLGQSVSYARDLGNHPANILTPTYIAKEAIKISEKSPKMECTIFDIKEIKKMGLEAFYGVARGAKEPAKMIIVEYQGGRKKQRPIALIGKGLTFDSGGISIKPSAKMDEMKFDMCGSSVVMGVLNAVCELKPKINILFAIGSTENMPGGNAQRPGDIVKAYNGKTIEVLNTDAEGRLVLADVLSYVNKNYSPDAILDFATLTGAVLVALGNRASGIMGNNQSLMKEVIKASKISGEKVWELPLWEEYSREIKGKYADLKNIGEAGLAGTITAGAFLKEFVENTPWVHMDIAGTAWGPKEPSYQPKVGATGVAVRLVYNFIENRL